MLDESGTHIAIYLRRELIAVVETPAECLDLIAIARQADNIIYAIVLEVEHETMLLVVESYTHNSFDLNYGHKVRKKL